MAQQTIFLGTVPNDNTGDDLRTGGDKINDNFTELYAASAGMQPLDSDLTAIAALSTTLFGRSLLEIANSAALAALVGGREVLTTNRAYYIKTPGSGGSDSNDGLTPGTAWATLQYASNFIRDHIDIAGKTITINVGAGTFAGVAWQDYHGGGNIVWKGDNTNPANVILTNSVTSTGFTVGTFFAESDHATDIWVSGFKFVPTAGPALDVDGRGIIILGEPTFLESTKNIYAGCQNTGAGVIIGNIFDNTTGTSVIDGTALSALSPQCFFVAPKHGYGSIYLTNYSITGTLVVSRAFLSVSNGFTLNAYGTATGTVTGPRFRVFAAGQLYCDTLTSINGSSDGIYLNGGMVFTGSGATFRSYFGTQNTLIRTKAGTPNVTTELPSADNWAIFRNTDDGAIGGYANRGGTLVNIVREKLTAARTYYVKPPGSGGSDSNDGLTLGTAFATVMKAHDTIVETLDLNNFSATILVSDGTYNEQFKLRAPFNGAYPADIATWNDTAAPRQGMINIFGNATDPNAVIFDCLPLSSAGYGIVGIWVDGPGAYYRITDLKIKYPDDDGIVVSNYAIVFLHRNFVQGKVVFERGPTPSGLGSTLRANDHGQLLCYGESYQFSGSNYILMNAYEHGSISYANAETIFVGTPNYDHIATTFTGGHIALDLGTGGVTGAYTLGATPHGLLYGRKWVAEATSRIRFPYLSGFDGGITEGTPGVIKPFADFANQDYNYFGVPGADGDILVNVGGSNASPYNLLGDGGAGGYMAAVAPLSLGIRAKLQADITRYVRANLGTVTISVASPGVASLTAHGLSANDPVIFSCPLDRGTFTVTIANPGVFTKTGHGFANDDPVILRSTGALPTGLTDGLTVYARNVATDTFEVSLSPGGGSINTIGTQSGTHTVERASILPTGLTDGLIVYVKTVIDPNSFTVSDTAGGAVINTSGTPRGKFTLQTGNDSNDGTTQTRTGAWLNAYRAWDYAAAEVDLNQHTLSIQVADGTHYEPENNIVRISDGDGFPGGATLGGGVVQFLGNASNKDAVVFKSVSDTLYFSAAISTSVSFRYFRLHMVPSPVYLIPVAEHLAAFNTGGNEVTVRDITLAGTPQLGCINVIRRGARVAVAGTIDVLCDGRNVLQSQGGSINVNTLTNIVAYGSRTFADGVIQVSGGGNVSCVVNTWTGTFVGQKYQVYSGKLSVLTLDGFSSTAIGGSLNGVVSGGGSYEETHSVADGIVFELSDQKDYAAHSYLKVGPQYIGQSTATEMTPSTQDVRLIVEETEASGNSPGNTVPTVLRLSHKTGTGNSPQSPTLGIGVALDFNVETSDDNEEVGAVIKAITTDITAASEDFDLIFELMTAGAVATEKFRLKSTGYALIGRETPETFDALSPKFQIHDTSISAGIGIARYVNSSGAPRVIFGKSRGATIGAMTTVNADDFLGKFEFQGCVNNSAFIHAARIDCAVDGTPTVNQIPGRLSFYTSGNPDDPLERLRVDSGGKVVAFAPLGGLGYGTGAGGTQTQNTSKSTGVTLNNVCGAITMNNASLNDATTVSFTLTNSAIEATDTVIVNHGSAGTAGAYIVQANNIGSGSCNISVRNVSGGSLSEAIVLTFALIKAKSA